MDTLQYEGSSEQLVTTLSKAHELFLTSGNSLSPEMITIRSAFLSPRHARAFKDDTLYLSFLKNLIEKRYEISVPDESSLCDRFFEDCITLKKLEQSLPSFSVEHFLEDTIHMIETLKTPYYGTYFQALSSMKSTFSDASLMGRTLQEFYGLMLKSSDRELKLIGRIAEQGIFYHDIFPENESMIRELLLTNLAQFSSPGNHLSLTALDHYFDVEKEFFRDTEIKDFTFSKLLAERMLFMEKYEGTTPSSCHRSDPPLADDFQHIDSEFLNHYAYNMNARSYVTNPAIGREDEIKDLALILISPKKSPILIGEAGVGKTSVVEGLAYALQKGNVPELLKKKKIFKLTTTSLLSGTKYVGEMEERMQKLMDELEKYPDVILFIDEIHTIVGAGSTESSNNDIANMLKPYIDRGDIKLIGATTSGEYHRFIMHDPALSRRFYPIEIEAPDTQLCLKILTGTIPSISAATNVHNPYDEDETKRILSCLLSICTPEHQPENLRTNWPELPLSILEMAFSYAALDSRTEVCLEDFVQAVCHSNRLKKTVKSDAGKYFVL